MITMNLHNVFFILMCSYALFSTFRGSFRADCIEQFTTFERQFFRCLLAGLCNVPAKSDREDVGNGAYTLRPHPGQEFQTICRCHSLAGSTFSSDILRLWVLVQSRVWTLDLRRSKTCNNQAAVFESLLKFCYAFHHITDINTPDTIHTWGAVTCHNQTQTPFDEIREKNVKRLWLKTPPFSIALIKVGSNWTATVASSRHST